ncbi:hypothetical protein RHIZO_04002 [Rhizobiaceae bacterium]|nr:hypothetical protein RHIZO_04002 [Rhizobiaceae bacterium]
MSHKKLGPTPTQPIGAGAVGRYRDRILDDPRHDPYQAKQKYAEPTTCPDCRASFVEGRWRRGPVEGPAHAARCPACRRIAERMPAGTLDLEGPYVAAHADELERMLRHVAEREGHDHPLHRIMAIEREGERLRVTTTDVHLPQRMLEAVRSAHQGAGELHYGHDDYSVRAAWRR